MYTVETYQKGRSVDPSAKFFRVWIANPVEVADDGAKHFSAKPKSFGPLEPTTQEALLIVGHRAYFDYTDEHGGWVQYEIGIIPRQEVADEVWNQAQPWVGLSD